MKVMVTGHRPPGIGGYDTPNATEQWVRSMLREILAGLKGREDDLVGVTGMALGTDQIFAEECVRLGIPFVAALPFKDMGSRWPASSQLRLQELLKQAREVVVVDDIPAYHSDHFAGKMACRNKWLVDHSGLTIAVWSGVPGGTAHTVEIIRRRKDRKILRLNPMVQTSTVEEPEPDEDLVLDMFGEGSERG